MIGIVILNIKLTFQKLAKSMSLSQTIAKPQLNTDKRLLLE